MVDNMEFHNRAWMEFIERRGVEVKTGEFLNTAKGRRNTEILEILLERKIEKKEQKIFEEEKESIYREIYKPVFKEIAGFKTFLSKLDELGIKTGVATNANLENRIFTLELLELQDFFTVVVGSEDVEKGKPIQSFICWRLKDSGLILVNVWLLRIRHSELNQQKMRDLKLSEF